MRKTIIFLIVFCLCFSTANITYAAPKIILNGDHLNLDVTPVIQNGRTLVPLRNIFQALSASILWDDQTKTVIANRNASRIKIAIGSHYAFKNDRKIELDTPAMIIDGRAMVPLRFVAEALECNITWDSLTETITIDDSQSLNNAEHSKIDYVEYINPIYGFKLNYPKEWLVSNNKNHYFFGYKTKNEDDYDPRVHILILDNEEVDLEENYTNEIMKPLIDEIMKQLINKMMMQLMIEQVNKDINNFILLESSNIFIGEQSAVKIIFTGDSESNLNIKSIYIAAYRNAKFYYVTCSTSADSPETFSIFEKVINSFEFI